MGAKFNIPGACPIGVEKAAKLLIGWGIHFTIAVSLFDIAGIDRVVLIAINLIDMRYCQVVVAPPAAPLVTIGCK